MGEMAAKFDKKRRDDAKRMGGSSPSSFGIKGLDALRTSLSNRGGGGGVHDNATAISSETYNKYNDNSGHGSGGNLRVESHGTSRYGKRGKFGGRDSDSEDNGNYNAKTTKKGSKKSNKKSGMKIGMKLGGTKQRDNLFNDVAELDKRSGRDSSKYNALLAAAADGQGDDGLDDMDGGDRAPIEVIISEKLYVSFDRDGGMKKFEIKGDMEVAVNDPSSTQCVIETNMKPSAKHELFDKIAWRLHPRMNSTEWKKGILCLKDAQKKFRVGRNSKTSILKWKMSSSDDGNVPIAITFWPETESNGSVTVNAQYQCNKALKNVCVVFPTPTSEEPEVGTCDNGDTKFSRGDKEFQWILYDLEADTEGSLEYVVEDVQLEDMWPIAVHFEIETTYSQIEVKAVHDLDNENQFEFSAKGTCVTEKYLLEE